MQRFYDNEGMNFAVYLTLGFCYAGLADAGETLATIEKIPEGDGEAWVREWTTIADRLASDASDAEVLGHRVSARTRYLRASTYYDLASSMAPGGSDPTLFTKLWERHRDGWDHVVDLFEIPVERIEIPYEGTTLAGYVLTPNASQTPKPTIILNNGSDGPISSQLSLGGRAALARGWNVILFDGPGQGAALHRQHLYFRYDWEKVITPVVDFIVERPDVDSSKIVLQGISQGGYWAPRAAAFEHRLAALVADPGVLRVASSWESHLPPDMVELLDNGNKTDFDAVMGMDPDEGRQRMLAWRMAPYGVTSPFDAYIEARKQTLDAATVAQIQCPTLVLSPDHEQFWPGQSQQLFDALAAPKALVRFTEAEGADWHCEPAAQSLRDERVFDWLETTLGVV